MKCILFLVCFLVEFSFSLVQIELKKSLAKNHSYYLMKLKLMQISSKKRALHKANGFFSFLEEKEIPLHQQVYLIKINIDLPRNV